MWAIGMKGNQTIIRWGHRAIDDKAEFKVLSSELMIMKRKERWNK